MRQRDLKTDTGIGIVGQPHHGVGHLGRPVHHRRARRDDALPHPRFRDLSGRPGPMARRDHPRSASVQIAWTRVLGRFVLRSPGCGVARMPRSRRRCRSRRWAVSRCQPLGLSRAATRPGRVEPVEARDGPGLLVDRIDAIDPPLLRCRRGGRASSPSRRESTRDARSTARYMSAIQRAPSGPVLSIVGRNQLSLEARNSRFASSGPRRPRKVTPSGSSTIRCTRLWTGSLTNRLVANSGPNRSSRYGVGLLADVTWLAAPGSLNRASVRLMG